jgi:hypothetical protein
MKEAGMPMTAPMIVRRGAPQQQQQQRRKSCPHWSCGAMAAGNRLQCNNSRRVHSGNVGMCEG